MESIAPKYGARVYALPSGTILIKQTVKSGSKYTDEYVIDTHSDGSHIEIHVTASNDHDIADAVRRAVSGTL